MGWDKDDKDNDDDDDELYGESGLVDIQNKKSKLTGGCHSCFHFSCPVLRLTGQ